MILEPTGDNIVLLLPKKEAKKKEETTASGIVLPSMNKTEQDSRQDIAEVIAVGEGRMLNNGTLLPMKISAGNKVLFNKYAGTEVIIDEDTYTIIKESDVLAIIK